MSVILKQQINQLKDAITLLSKELKSSNELSGTLWRDSCLQKQLIKELSDIIDCHLTGLFPDELERAREATKR
jgi:hypothetical protein